MPQPLSGLSPEVLPNMYKAEDSPLKIKNHLAQNVDSSNIEKALIRDPKPTN